MQRPTTTYILDQIALHAQEQPDATAIEHGSRRVTYGELPSLIHREASVLREFGFPAGSPVMVALPRGPEQVVTMLALWSAGLAFLPVDPSDPAARLAEIHNATGAVATILASEDPAAGAGATRLDVHDSAARSSGGLAASAYVIFTSGSTGTPKGVVASHEAFVSLIALLVERYAITPADRVLQFAAPTFDTALEQIGVTLAAGAALIQPDSLWAPSEFANLLVRHRVSVMDLTPSYWRAVAAFESASLPHDTDQVRLVILGGAAVSNQDLLSVHDRYGQARIINAYGLSETGITSCLSEPDMTTLSPEGPAAVGKAVPGAVVAILDENHVPIPSGMTGNVAIGGRLAIGSLTDNGQLATLDTTQFAGQPVYLTGDTGHLNAEDALVVDGRADRQLKVRGFRISPDEVEDVLRRSHAISDVAVIADTTSLQLHAFYTVTPGHADPGSDALVATAKQALPAYSVPHRAVVLDALPQTTHGKTDYRALAAFLTSNSADAATPYELRSSIERAIAGVWTEVLGISTEQLGASFFDVGGTSITAAELVARTRSSLGIHVRFVRGLIERLLTTPTFPAYCAAVEEARAGVLQAEEMPREAMTADLRRPATPTLQPLAESELTSSSVILLTGATGFLGAHLLPRLLAHTPARVACLVRADTEDAARERLRGAWKKYDSAPDVPDDAFDRIEIVLGDLGLPSLGMSASEFDALAARTSMVFHSGGLVNFIYPYAEMKHANVDGTYELLRLAAYRGAAFHHVSTMAVIAGHGAVEDRFVREDDPLDHLDQLGVGYVESKWMAEHHVRKAADAGLPVAIYRAADISGHSLRGTWNTTTEMCCMKRFIRDIAAIPVAELPMDYTPVDVFADAMVHIATTQPANGRVFHLTNPHKSHISVLRDRLHARGHEVGELAWPDWVAQMIDLAVANPQHPMTPFAPLFIDRSPNGKMSVAEMYLEDTYPEFSRTNVEDALDGTDITFPQVDGPLIDRYLDFLERAEFL
ncbi:hypothetical protein KACC15558_34260 [Brevibacterium ammoniilyticum]|uniref:Carrier domain-containing protein n=1 Tax=Brevibacterium ammoniilyticum TaxID=1046555 RepID=A0ABP9U478_9MICO